MKASLEQYLWNAHALVAQRSQVAPTRIRVPDICVVIGKGPHPDIFCDPPFICIEVFSNDDTLHDMQDRIGRSTSARGLHDRREQEIFAGLEG
jgi:hypothetical protein